MDPSVEDFRELRRQHPEAAGWLALPSDATSHGVRFVHAQLVPARLASRRFYEPSSGFVGLDGAITVCCSAMPVVQTVRDPAFVELLQAVADGRGSLCVLAPAYADACVSTLASNHERGVFRAAPLVAERRVVEATAAQLGLPVTDGALVARVAPLTELVATAAGAALVGSGPRVGLISVGAPSQAEMWRRWRLVNEACAAG